MYLIAKIGIDNRSGMRGHESDLLGHITVRLYRLSSEDKQNLRNFGHFLRVPSTGRFNKPKMEIYAT
jgi:hypothetical protein